MFGDGCDGGLLLDEMRIRRLVFKLIVTCSTHEYCASASLFFAAACRSTSESASDLTGSRKRLRSTRLLSHHLDEGGRKRRLKEYVIEKRRKSSKSMQARGKRWHKSMCSRTKNGCSRRMNR
jgi:hypothetical protein